MKKLVEFGKQVMFYVRVLYEERRIRAYRLKLDERLLKVYISAKVDFMDMKHISSDASPQLFMDMLVGDKSIVRKVFGQSRRFQPNLPSTKAQAAVVMISGKIKGAIDSELLRLDSESSVRQTEMEEIKKELLSTRIQRFWHEKLE